MENLKFPEKKSLKSRNSKFQKCQTQFCEDHWKKIQEKFESYWLSFVGGVAI